MKYYVEVFIKDELVPVFSKTFTFKNLTKKKHLDKFLKKVSENIYFENELHDEGNENIENVKSISLSEIERLAFIYKIDKKKLIIEMKDNGFLIKDKNNTIYYEEYAVEKTCILCRAKMSKSYLNYDQFGDKFFVCKNCFEK